MPPLGPRGAGVVPGRYLVREHHGEGFQPGRRPPRRQRVQAIGGEGCLRQADHRQVEAQRALAGPLDDQRQQRPRDQVDAEHHHEDAVQARDPVQAARLPEQERGDADAPDDQDASGEVGAGGRAGRYTRSKPSRVSPFTDAMMFLNSSR